MSQQPTKQVTVGSSSSFLTRHS